MNEEQFKSRTKQLALRVIRLVETLPSNRTANVIGRQLLRSATSVGANYRAACRARSKPEFYSKICIVLEEADESLYWLELLEDLKTEDYAELKPLKNEALELVKIFATTRKTAKNN